MKKINRRVDVFAWDAYRKWKKEEERAQAAYRRLIAQGGWVAGPRRELEALRQKTREALAQTERRIAALPDGRLRLLLRCRYIDGWSWQRIAWKCGWKDEGTPRKRVRKFLQRETAHGRKDAPCPAREEETARFSA